MLCLRLIDSQPTAELTALLNIYFSVIKKSYRAEEGFNNYFNFENKAATKQNQMEDIEETKGRALLALAEALGNKSLRNEAKEMFLRALKTDSNLTHLRAVANTIKALSTASKFLPQYKQRPLGTGLKTLSPTITPYSVKVYSLPGRLWERKLI